MGNGGHTTCANDPVDGILQRRPTMIDIAGAPRHDVGLKNAAHIFAHTALDKIPGEMRAANQTGVFGMAHGTVETAVNAHLLELRRHSLRPIDSTGTDRGQPGFECLILSIEAQTKNVNLQTSPLDGNLHAVDETHPEFVGDSACRRQATQFVMIGQCQHIDAISRRTTSNLRRRK